MKRKNFSSVSIGKNSDLNSIEEKKVQASKIFKFYKSDL